MDIDKCLRKLRYLQAKVFRESYLLSWKGLRLLIVTVATIWFLYGLAIVLFIGKVENRGLSGDMFGGITALFSGLAFAGLIFTLFVQKKELQYQREELGHLVEEQRQTKGHLKDQATHLKSQSDFIERQIFENNFFQLLSSFNVYVSNTRLNRLKISYVGHDAYGEIYEDLLTKISGFYEDHKPGSVQFIATYKAFFEDHKDDLGPYYRQLYNILKFIKMSNLNDKGFYSNIVRAQLSDSELTLLACNIASEHGSKKMAPLVREFDLLKHCSDEKILKSDIWDTHLTTFFDDWNFPRQ